MGLRPYKVVKVDYELTATLLADMFWQMDNVEMAEFFNRLGVIFDNNYSVSWQMQELANTKELGQRGIDAIKHLASVITFLRGQEHG